jgi:ABC-2 type transport system ATP-binding protein
VADAAELGGIPRRAAVLRAHEVLDLVGLDDARMRAVEAYSTGMHQRVKLAMALVHDPELLLLDEPTSGLDPDSRDDLLALIQRLRDGDGPAVLLSTHLLHDVERTCDTVVIMHEGQVRFSGPLAELQVASTSQYELRIDGEPSAFAAALARAGASVQAGRRPESLLVSLAAGHDARTIWWAAGESATRLWHLEPRALSLEEAFLSAIGAAP